VSVADPGFDLKRNVDFVNEGVKEFIERVDG